MKTSEEYQSRIEEEYAGLIERTIKFAHESIGTIYDLITTLEVELDCMGEDSYMSQSSKKDFYDYLIELRTDYDLLAANLHGMRLLIDIENPEIKNDAQNKANTKIGEK